MPSDDKVYRIVVRRADSDDPFMVQHNANYRPCVYTKLSTAKAALKGYKYYNSFFEYRIEELEGVWVAVPG